VRSGSGTAARSGSKLVSVVCNAGVVALATGQKSPSAIAVDAAGVYWTNAGDGTVMEVPLAGGTPVTLASRQGSPTALAIDATNAYFANWDSGAVMKVPLAGGATTFLAAGSSPTGIAVGTRQLQGKPPESVIYFTSTGDGQVRQVFSDGTASSATASGQTMPTAVAACGTRAFWTDSGSGLVKTSEIVATATGRDWVTLASGQNYPTPIAVHCATTQRGPASGKLYWANAGDGSIMSQSSATVTGTPQVLASHQGVPTAIAIYQDRSLDDVYWTDSTTGSIVGKKSGSKPVVLARGLGYPSAVTVDATSVYWTDSSDGTVMKVPR
jgi:hypothetical protein